jgi:hypothetical protein
MTPHAHQLSKTDNSTTGSTQGSQPQASTTIVTEPTSLKIINARLDRIVSLLESYNRMLALLLDPAQREKLKPQDDFQGDRNLLDNR